MRRAKLHLWTTHICAKGHSSGGSCASTSTSAFVSATVSTNRPFTAASGAMAGFVTLK